MILLVTSIVLLNEVPQDFVPPVVKDDRLVLTLFAAEPEIVTPTGIAIDADGRIFVIESHTHFRPKDYDGPEKDRIRIFEDTDKNGRADKITTFCEGTSSTMNLGFGPKGELYVATRREILLFKDPKSAKGLVDARTIIRLQTSGDYPHNGLSGFAFAPDGEVWIGLGENLGVPYSLVGSDGVVLTGGGEGGSIYSCLADGSRLRRVATGFWNPYHLFKYRNGALFAVDNDPDSRPPCRLLHIVQGGDYGFKFRYGRNGLHPFHAWDGELPGTLPMVCGTGEAPSGMVGYVQGTFPTAYLNALLVTSWGDHRIERFRLQPNGSSYRSTMEPIVVGDENFRPVGIAIAPDGSIYFSDWVDKSYELHGKGRVWRLAAKEPLSPPEKAAEPPNGEPINASLFNDRRHHDDREKSSKPDPLRDRKEIVSLNLLDSPDPFLRTSARQGLMESLAVDGLVELFRKEKGPRRAEVLLTIRDLDATSDLGFLREALLDPDPTVRLIAVQWIGDRRLKEFRPDLETLLSGSGPWTRSLLESTLAAIEILDRGWATPEAGSGFAVRLLDRGDLDPSVIAALLRTIPPSHEWLTVERYKALSQSKDDHVAIEAVRSLRESHLAPREPLLAAIAMDAERPDSVRTEAILGLGIDTLKSESLTKVAWPPLQQELDRRQSPKATHANSPDQWHSRLTTVLQTPGDTTSGERLFFDPNGPGCFRCHQSGGRGATVGPDLSVIAQGMSRQKLLESLVDPSREVAPRYVPWRILLEDGRVQEGLLAREGLKGEQTYVGSDGKEFVVLPDQIVERTASSTSLMPAGLMANCTDQEIRDLFAYLESLKGS